MTRSSSRFSLIVSLAAGATIFVGALTAARAAEHRAPQKTTTVSRDNDARNHDRDRGEPRQTGERTAPPPNENAPEFAETEDGCLDGRVQDYIRRHSDRGIIDPFVMLELRAALDAARAVLALPALTYTNAITAGTTRIYAADLTEIRNGVK